MSEQTISCPSCGTEIPLTEALEEKARQQLQRQETEFKARLEQKLRQDFTKELEGLKQENREKAERLAAMECNELTLRQERQALEEAKRRQELEFARRLDQERETIRTQAVAEALEQHRLQDADKDRQLADLKREEAVFEQREAELAGREQSFNVRVEEELLKKEAVFKQQLEEQLSRRFQGQLETLRQENAEHQERLRHLEDQELALRKDKQALEAEKRRLELEVTRQVDEARGRIRSEAVNEIEEYHRLKDLEKDKQLTDLKQQLDLMKRRMEQGSQQLQGEVLELDLEALLTVEFPGDTIEPVPKGVRGADVHQRVNSASGRYCGMVVWEAKRTRNWSEGWVQKLKDNQRQVNAEIAVLVTDVLPKDVRHFGYRDGIWVTDHQHVVALTNALRMQILKVGQMKQVMDGKQEKAEVLYAYLTSVEFRYRVENMVEAFTNMKGDLEQERRAMERIWSKREKELTRMLDNVSGMYGDLQGLVGNSLPPIKSLALPAATEVEPNGQVGSDVPF